jgi:DNA topoisomerase IA
MTAQWEERLAKIKKSEENPVTFMNDIRDYTAKFVDEIKALKESMPSPDEMVVSKCPKCEFV